MISLSKVIAFLNLKGDSKGGKHLVLSPFRSRERVTTSATAIAIVGRAITKLGAIQTRSHTKNGKD